MFVSGKYTWRIHALEWDAFDMKGTPPALDAPIPSQGDGLAEDSNQISPIQPHKQMKGQELNEAD
jgi:hypothetical protein